MRFSVVLALVVCGFLVQSAQAVKKKIKGGHAEHEHEHEHGGGNMDIDPEEMMKHMSEKCLQFFMNPKNLQKMQDEAATNPQGVLDMMLSNGCEDLVEWMTKKAMG